MIENEFRNQHRGHGDHRVHKENQIKEFAFLCVSVPSVNFVLIESSEP
jgi:hypothetical protein